MPPDERRAAIVQAALPLLEEHGTDVSTRQIAEAAGVAEGTIFRAFGNKDALIDAVMATAFEAGPLIEALRSIDLTLPLRDRLVESVEISQTRLRSVFKLLFALRMRPGHWQHDAKEERRRKADAEQANTVIVDLISPDAGLLRYSPEEVAHRIRLVTFSATHPMISDGHTLTAEEIVDFALDGVRKHDPGDL